MKNSPNNTPDDPRHNASSVAWRISAMAFFGGIGGGVVFPILPALGERMGLSALIIGIILAANRVVRMAINPVTGTLTDRFGGREVIAAGLFIEGVGSIGYIAALHYPHPAAWFLAGRVVWGVGSSLLFVGSVSAVLALSGSRERGRLVARARSAISLGVPGGLALGGVITDLVNADTAFIVATALSIGAGLFSLAAIPPRTQLPARAAQPTPLPAPGRFRHWLAILGERRLAGVWTYTALVFFCYGGVLLATLVVLIGRRHTLVPGLDAEGSAGLLMCAMVLSYAGVSLYIGRRIDDLGRRTSTLLPAVLVLIAGCTLCAFARDLGWLLLALVMIGAGAGSITIPVLTLIGDLVSPERRGRATGMYQVSADTGAAAGAILGLVFGVRYGFTETYLGLAAIFVLSLPVALVLIRAERRQQAAAGESV